MNQERDNSALTADYVKELSNILYQTDELIKGGKFKEALEKIEDSQSRFVRNSYTQAYFERVRHLFQESEKRKSKKPYLPDQEYLLINEKIVQLALEDAERQVSIFEKERNLAQLLSNEIEVNKKNEEVRRATINDKVVKLFARVQEYYERKDYQLALTELNRIPIFDPSNKEVEKLKAKILADQEQEKKLEEEEQRREKEEFERKKLELLGQELSRIRQDIQEHKRKEEEKRRIEIERKIQEHIRKTRTLLSNQQYDDALNEITQAIVLDPVHEEAITLEKEIREEQRKIKEEEEKVYIQKRDEEKNKEEKIKRQVQKYLSEAQSLAQEHKYFEALQLVARAYILNPMDEEIATCENNIVELQNRYYQKLKAERDRQKDELRKRKEEEIRQMIEAERIRILEVVLKDDDGKVDETKEQITEYLFNAQNFLNEERYKEALGEIAAAFIIDPLSEDIAELEKKIQQAISKKKEKGKGKQKDKTANDKIKIAPPMESEKSVHSVVSEHISEAMRLRDNYDFDNALDKIAEAMGLDPSNEGLETLHQQIRMEYARYKREQEIQKAVSKYIDQARKCIEEGKLGEAENEIARGLDIKESNEVLLKLKAEVTKLLANQRKTELELHIKNAQDFINQDLLDDALMEIARGFMIDPNNAKLLDLEKRVEKKRQNEFSGGYSNDDDILEEAGYEELQEYVSTAERYLLDGKFDEAHRTLKKASRIDPTDQSVQELLDWIEQEKSGALNSRSSLKLLYNRRRSAG